MTKRAPSLRSRLMTVIFAVVCSLFVLEFIMALLWLRSRYLEETSNELEIASAIGLTFKSLVRDISRTEYVIGLSFQYKPFPNGKALAFYQMINEIYPVVQNFVIADSGGIIITGSTPELIGVSVSDKEYFQQLKQSDTVVTSSFLRIIPDKRPGFIIARGFYSPDGTLEYAVIAGVLAEKLGEISLAPQRRSGEFITLFDSEGTLVYTNQKLENLTDSLRFNWKAEDKLLQKALQGQHATGFFDAPVKNYSRRVGARTSIEGLNWVSGAAVIQWEFFQPLVISFIVIFISMIIVAGITVLFAERMIQTITDSLRSVQNHVSNVAQGKFAAMQSASGLIEFDNLINDTNTMAQKLKNREERLRLLAAVVENSNDLMLLSSPGMVPFYINEAGSRLVGVESENVDQTQLPDYFSLENRKRFEMVIRPALLNENRWVGEVNICNSRTGEQIPTIWNTFAIKSENGTVIAWATICPDLTDLKKTTDALRKSEEKFRGAVDGLLDAFVIMAPVRDAGGNLVDLTFEYINRVALAIMKERAEDLIGKHEKDLFSTDITSRLMAIYDSVLKTGEPVVVSALPVYQMPASQDMPGYIDISASNLSGKIAVAWRDVTLRVNAEQTLRESEEKFRSLAENAPEIIARFDPQLKHIYINNYGEKVYGVTREQIIGKSITDTGMPARIVTLWNNNMEMVLKTATNRTIDYEFDSPTFGHQYFSSIYVPEYNKKRKIVSILVITRDVTEIKIAENALRKSEERFRDLANSLPQLVWTANPDGSIDYYNERYHDFGGIAPKVDGNWHWAPAVYEKDYKATVDAWNVAVHTGNVYQIEHRVRHTDGNWYWYLSRGIPVRDDNGAIIKWYGTATNIDSTKKVQLALEESESRLKALNQDLETIVQKRTDQVRSLSKALILAEQRERKRFSYILHENLQQMILGSKILLNQHLRDHKEVEPGEIDDISESIKILESALQTTKVLSIELNPPVLSWQGLDAALKWLVNHMRQNYSLIVDLKTSGPADRIKNETQLMLTQMVRELLNNVVQHADVHHVNVKADISEKTITITVCDKGRGFNPLEESNKKISGTRLGLFSIRERLKLFGGDLKIESAPGKGTCSIIVLPQEPA